MYNCLTTARIWCTLSWWPITKNKCLMLRKSPSHKSHHEDWSRLSGGELGVAALDRKRGCVAVENGVGEVDTTVTQCRTILLRATGKSYDFAGWRVAFSTIVIATTLYVDFKNFWFIYRGNKKIIYQNGKTSGWFPTCSAGWLLRTPGLRVVLHIPRHTTAPRDTLVSDSGYLIVTLTDNKLPRIWIDIPSSCFQFIFRCT